MGIRHPAPEREELFQKLFVNYRDVSFPMPSRLRSRKGIPTFVRIFSTRDTLGAFWFPAKWDAFIRATANSIVCRPPPTNRRLRCDAFGFSSCRKPLRHPHAATALELSQTTPRPPRSRRNHATYLPETPAQTPLNPATKRLVQFTPPNSKPSTWLSAPGLAATFLPHCRMFWNASGRLTLKRL
jgi:hypothetical protein